MEFCKNCKNHISYSEFLNYLDSGGWALSIGINDRMTIDEHLSYIDSIMTFEDALVDFIPNGNIPEQFEKIDVFIKPTVRESEISSRTKHIQFKKERG